LGKIILKIEILVENRHLGKKKRDLQILYSDQSTSMLIGGRLEMVRQAVRRFIYAISEGTYIGLVTFNKLSAVRHELKRIDDEDSRNILSSRLTPFL